ncbi:DNA replication complex subunit Gins51 [Haloparvum sedimenti]|uniref:DNA replication complex subunit Gins51 n=1 Tax=Haloparvum sedimenti TaxID=1678448 RepID=UPI00071E7561|nr:hypothetical protein [Haloparvum sedimenti]
MNLDELRSVQAKERRKDSLQHLRDDFYDEVASYVADLRAARDRRAESVENPFSDDDVRRMSDEVETAEEVAEALYERRVGKVVKLASFAAADMPVEREGMTNEERELFEDLVGRIEENKRSVLDVLSGEVAPSAEPVDADSNPDAAPRTEGVTEDAPTPSADDPVPPADPATERSADADGGAADEGGVLADAMGAGGDDPSASGEPSEPTADAGPSEGPSAGAGSADADADGRTPVAPDPAPPGAPGASEPDDGGEETATADAAADPADEEPPETPSIGEIDDRTTVRITADVGEILGVDEREYDLAAEDVVTLPAANAEPLIQRDAAERID